MILYDRLYKKYGDRDTAIEKLKRTDLTAVAVSLVLIPAAAFAALFFIFRRTVTPASVVIPLCLLIYIAVSYAARRKNGYRYVHCSHDVKGVIKEFETEKGCGEGMTGEGGDGSVFKYTLDNDAAVNCSFDGGVYTFTVLNDEWDEAGSFTACREEDFEQTAKKALFYAASLEKKPDGEYDETLQPEVEIDEYEDDGYEEEYAENPDGEEEER